MNNILGPYAKVSNGRLYPLLAKLEETALIEGCEETDDQAENGRHVRSFKITERGIERLHELMMDTNSNPGDYQKLFFHKIPTLSYLQPAERERLIDHYSHFCQTHILYLNGRKADLAKKLVNLPYYVAHEEILEAIQHRIEQWELELSWTKRLREKFLTLPTRVVNMPTKVSNKVQPSHRDS